MNRYWCACILFHFFPFVKQCMTPWCSDPVARPPRHRSLIRPVLPTLRAPPSLGLPRAAGSLRRSLPRPAGATAGSLRPSLPSAAGAAGILRRNLPGAAAPEWPHHKFPGAATRGTWHAEAREPGRRAGRHAHGELHGPAHVLASAPLNATHIPRTKRHKSLFVNFKT